MAAASLDILADRTRWSGMSKLAAIDARERFGREEVVSQYESLYRQSLPAQIT
jgi:hypothetical protein